jgi:hypothetical protein
MELSFSLPSSKTLSATLARLGSMLVFILSSRMTWTSKHTIREGRRTTQNICSSLLGFVFILALVSAVCSVGYFSREFLMCGFASSLQCWVMCWNLSLCERDLGDAKDLRNDMEVLAGTKGAIEKRDHGRWSTLSKQLHLASRLSSWLFTSSILCTWWDISLHWTINISLSMNVGISLTLGLMTWRRGRVSSKQVPEKKTIVALEHYTLYKTMNVILSHIKGQRKYDADSSRTDHGDDDFEVYYYK